MEESDIIIIRPFRQEDAGLIFSTWPKGLYYGSVKRIEEGKKAWFEKFYETVQASLKKDQVLIACLGSDPDIIAGYSILDEYGALRWIYVKEMYRLQGIATLLFKDRLKIVSKEFLTRAGKKVLLKLETENRNGI